MVHALALRLDFDWPVGGLDGIVSVDLGGLRFAQSGAVLARLDCPRLHLLLLLSECFFKDVAKQHVFALPHEEGFLALEAFAVPVD